MSGSHCASKRRRKAIGHRYDFAGMAATTTVQFDSDLLARLRARHPGKDDRALLEDLARIELGFAAMRDVHKRSGLDETEAAELAVRAVHETRPPGE